MRPGFGSKPQRSAKAAAAALMVDLTAGQLSALTSQIGVASGVGCANASKGPPSDGKRLSLISPIGIAGRFPRAAQRRAAVLPD